MIWKSRLEFAGAIVALLLTQAVAQSNSGIETVVVTANAPLPGSNLDPDKLAGEFETLSIPDVTRDKPNDVLPNAVATRLASVSLSDEQGSQFQPDFDYRGFDASPISGVAEGIAVYQDGVRLNESFGDNVNWELIPEFAVRQFTLQSNNPVFGLNTMGGAVTLEMKNGLNSDGTDGELSGGSFANITGHAEYATRAGALGLYLGVGGIHDDGFRYRSPTNIGQAYGDLAYENGTLTLHLTASGALDRIAAVGPTPVELLAADPRSVFTFPQSIRNEMELVQLHGTVRASSALTLSFSTYYRHFQQHLVDGNTTDVTPCENDPSQLCLEGNGIFPDDALYDSAGNPVPASVLPGNATPGETDFTHTDTHTLGAAAQITWSAPFFGHGNRFVLGASIDRGETDYSAFGELGVLLDNLQVVGVGVTIDQSRSPTASPPIEAPVNIGAQNTLGGIYAIDVFDIAPSLFLTVSGRFNSTDIRLRDRLGGSLSGKHSFSRFNPGTGLAYKFTHSLTGYIGYSESNRAPTAGELSCADPTSPCLLDAFLVSDPPLKQVVSHTLEAGLRGHFQAFALPGTFLWNASFYRTDADNDILLLATDINGFGFFQNAGTTRHQGVDLHLDYRDTDWRIAASYSYLDATFRNALALSSNSPAADADGLIHVTLGDHIPMNPANRLTISADYVLMSEWTVGADVRLQSGEYLVGDESNQEPKLAGFATVNLRSAYEWNAKLTLFADVQNLFDTRYYTYGSFTSLDGLPPRFDLTNPRTYSPAPGRLFFVGLRQSL